MDAHIKSVKWVALRKRMAELGIQEEDLIEKFIRGSGKGGQKINKTASCVYLKHKPSGEEIKCQRSRSREMNRFFVRRELCERMADKIEGEKSKRQAAIEKIRRQKRRRSRRQKEKMLEKKHQQAEKKARRQPVRNDDL